MSKQYQPNVPFTVPAMLLKRKTSKVDMSNQARKGDNK